MSLSQRLSRSSALTSACLHVHVGRALLFSFPCRSQRCHDISRIGSSQKVIRTVSHTFLMLFSIQFILSIFCFPQLFFSSVSFLNFSPNFSFSNFCLSHIFVFFGFFLHFTQCFFSKFAFPFFLFFLAFFSLFSFFFNLTFFEHFLNSSWNF